MPPEMRSSRRIVSDHLHREGQRGDPGLAGARIGKLDAVEGCQATRVIAPRPSSMLGDQRETLAVGEIAIKMALRPGRQADDGSHRAAPQHIAEGGPRRWSQRARAA